MGHGEGDSQAWQQMGDAVLSENHLFLVVFSSEARFILELKGIL